MADLRHFFDPVLFTQEEKEQLTARLRQAAEQEDNMKDSTKRAIRHTSHRLIIGVAVAAALTTGALAAAVGGGLMGYFEARTPEDQSTLAEGIYQLNRSETYNGWTVELTDCVGDDTNVYLWVDVTAPEGTILAPLHDGWFYGHFSLEFPAGVSGTVGSGIEPIPDQNPQDNRISFCLDLGVHDGTLRGQSIDVTLDTLVDRWWSDPLTDQAELHEWDMMGAIKDHVWVFEDVVLDYPDQAVRLTPDLEIPYMDGTATLTNIEITPLTATVRIEGGSCYDHHGRAAAEAAAPSDELVIDAGSAGSITLTEEDVSTWFECWDALETTLVMKDGTTVETPNTGLGGSSCQDGVSSDTYTGIPYVEKRFQYAENSNLIAPRVIDPAQVDYILVCGVRIDMPQ